MQLKKVLYVKAVSDGLVGPVLAGPTFTRGKKFYFTQGR